MDYWYHWPGYRTIWTIYQIEKRQIGATCSLYTISTKLFSYRTSENAREWINVEFSSERQEKPIKIESLTQTLIELQLISDTDALNSIELIFRVPKARILKVWWEQAPENIIEDSDLDFYFVNRQSMNAVEDNDSYWEIKVRLSQIKSFKRYKEEIKIGILADGDLNSITMPIQGSSGSVPLDQVWIAEFVPFALYLIELQKEDIRKNTVKFGFQTLLLISVIGFFVYIPKIWGSKIYLNENEPGGFYAGAFFGFLFAGIIGFILGQMRESRYQMTPRAWKTYPPELLRYRPDKIRKKL